MKRSVVLPSMSQQKQDPKKKPPLPPIQLAAWRPLNMESLEQQLRAQGEGGQRRGGQGPRTQTLWVVSPGWGHGLRILYIGHHHGRDGQHEATHHLFSVLRAPGVGKADEGAVNSDPSTPLELKHEAAHAEDHA